MDEKRFDHLVPQRLDDSGKFLFWDTDVAMAFVVAKRRVALTGPS